MAAAPSPSLEGIDAANVDEAEAMMDGLVLRFEPDQLPAYRRLLAEEGPLVRGFAYTFGEGPTKATIARNFPMPEEPTVMALSYEAVKECLFDQTRFNGKVYDDFGAAERGEEALPLMEGTPHLRLRRLIAQGLNPRSVQVWEERMVRPVVRGLLDQITPGAPVDLARTLCRPLPGAAVGAVLGLNPADLAAFNLLAFLSFTGPISDDGKRAERTLVKYFNEHVEHRRSLPADVLGERQDIISLMVKARVEDDHLSNEEIVPNLFFFLFAGSDTTYLTLCNIVYYLVEQPGLMQAVRDDRTKIPRLIEETLRLNPPGPVIGRRAKLDTEVCGVPVAKDTVIAINLLMSGHDPAAWDRPDDFDLDRPQEKLHLAFGFGPHMCPGMHLSRLEMTVALNELLDRYSTVRWARDAGRPNMVGVGSRAIEHTRVVLS
jgi:cytochrome P450